jgi:hypothetical protein
MSTMHPSQLPPQINRVPVQQPQPQDGIKDFTKERSRVLFRIDQDVFEATPALAPEVAFELMDLGPQIQLATQSNDDEVATRRNSRQTMKLISDVLAKIMFPDSSARFVERMSSVTEPIDFEQLMSVIQWLLEQYGLRPTESPQDSQSGSENPAAGTPSMAGPSPVALIPTASPSTGF